MWTTFLTDMWTPRYVLVNFWSRCRRSFTPPVFLFVNYKPFIRKNWTSIWRNELPELSEVNFAIISEPHDWWTLVNSATKQSERLLSGMNSPNYLKWTPWTKKICTFFYVDELSTFEYPWKCIICLHVTKRFLKIRKLTCYVTKVNFLKKRSNHAQAITLKCKAWTQESAAKKRNNTSSELPEGRTVNSGDRDASWIYPLQNLQY